MVEVAERPAVRVSTLLGMAVMDLAEASYGGASIMWHGMPRDLREQVRSRFIEAGWEARDTPSNGGMRGVKDPESGASIYMWLADSDRCGECNGSGVSPMEPGERCIVCKGRG